MTYAHKRKASASHQYRGQAAKFHKTTHSFGAKAHVYGIPVSLKYKYSKTGGAQDVSQHGDLSKTKFAISLNRPKHHFNHAGIFHYDDFKSGVIECLEGRQKASVMFYMFSQQQILDTTINATPTIGQWNVNPFMLNPYQYTTGSGPTLGSAGATLSVSSGGAIQSSAGQSTVLQPLVSDPQIKSDAVHIYSCDSDMQITNFSANPVHIDVMWLGSKRDVASDPITEWNQILASKAGGQGSVAAYNATKGSATAGYGFSDVYGYSPFSELEFNKMFKILHRETHALQGADTKKFLYKIHFNKHIGRSFYQQLATGGTYIFRNLTVVPVIIIRPCPVLNSTNTDCTTGVARLGFTATNKFHFAALNEQRIGVDRVYPYIQAANSGTLSTDAANENKMDDVDASTTNKLA